MFLTEFNVKFHQKRATLIARSVLLLATPEFKSKPWLITGLAICPP